MVTVKPDALAPAIEEIAAVVGRDDVLHARRDRLAYAYDAGEDPPRLPDMVVFPADAGEVSRVVRAARKANLPIVARGAGTNLSGGTLAVRGGVILECSRLLRIVEVDLDNRRVVVEPGVVNLDLQHLLARHGYFYGPDPASQKVSTLGGNVGENAGGPHCLKYGVTANHVLGMQVVLADGQMVEVGGPLEDAPGYDLTGLFVGSEGTLGIATRLTLRVLRSAEDIRTLLVIFDRIEDAGAAVAAVVAAGMVPATLEIMDQAVIQAVEAKRSYGFPLDAAAILLIEVDGLADELDRQVEEIAALCRQGRAREVRLARTAAEREALWAGRRGAFGAIARMTPAYLVQDGTVPRTALAAMLRKVGEITGRYGVAVANVAHAGDGNLHPLLMYDPGVPGQAGRVHAAAAEIMAECVRLGGTLTGEHGIGLSKLGAMPLQFGPAELRLQSQIKRALDPADALNPGKLLPDGPPPPPPAAGAPDPERLLDALRALGAAALRSTPGELAPYQVGPLRPVAAFRPGTVEAAGAAVRAAVEARVAVVPWGRGSCQDLGPVRPTEALVLDLGALAEIVEVDAGNQTITAGAGVTLGRIQGALAPHRLFLPLDPEGAAEMTLGGVVALAASGPRRLGYGLPRDLVLGLRVVTPAGELVRLGGKTMKDVAGYDLKRLLVGSRGTLGAIVEATLRLYPLPEARGALAARFADARAAGAAVRTILASPLMPVALDLVSAGLWPAAEGPPVRLAGAAALLLVGLEGRREGVARLARELSELVRASGGDPLVLPEESVEALWALRGRLLDRAQRGDALQVRFSVPIARLADVFAAAPASAGLAAHAAAGVGRMVLPSGDAAEALAGYAAVRRAAEAAGGFAYLERGPSDLLAARGEWPARADYALMRRIKAAIDPLGLFHPGRAPGSADEPGVAGEAT